MSQWNLPRKSRYSLNEEQSSITEVKLIDKEQSANTFSSNKIYFYGEVNVDTIYNLNRQLDDASKNVKIVQTMYDLNEVPRISLYIHSIGGDLMPALSSLSRIVQLKNQGFHIDTFVEGFCASAATIISIVGSKRYIRKYSCMMIHQLRSEFWGTFSEFQDEARNVEMIMNQIKQIYKDFTKIDDQYLSDILKHDLYLSAEECIKIGLVDEVL